MKHTCKVKECTKDILHKTSKKAISTKIFIRDKTRAIGAFLRTRSKLGQKKIMFFHVIYSKFGCCYLEYRLTCCIDFRGYRRINGEKKSEEKKEGEEEETKYIKFNILGVCRRNSLHRL